MIRNTLFCLLSGLLLTITANAQEVPIGKSDSLINTKWNETKPMLSPDGSRFYFTRSNDPNSVGGRKDRGDIMMVDLYQQPQTAQRVKGANSAEFDAVVGFTPAGDQMYVMHNDENAKYKKSANLFRVPVLGGTPQEEVVEYFYNKAKHQDISINPGGNIMLLSIEGYSTVGLEDLYVSFKQNNGKWSEPKNLGKTINTPMQELGGYLDEDGRNLYFFSNRKGGAGSMDVYHSVRLDDSWRNWTEPENLGVAINSSGAELAYYAPKKGLWAYYSTTQNSEGFGDIKRIRKPEEVSVDSLLAQFNADTLQQEVQEIIEEVVLIESDSIDNNLTEVADPDTVVDSSLLFAGSIISEDANKPLIAKVKVSKAISGFADSTTAANSFNLRIPSPGEYTVAVTARGFFSKDTTIFLNASRTNFRLNLKPITVGATVRLENVMFQRSTALLLEESYVSLNEVVKLMDENPGMAILLTGHTDNQGSSKANLKLSKDRVAAVKDYLISRGVDKDRIEGKGYGGLKPVASNASEETRKLNRRVEFTVIKSE